MKSNKPAAAADKLSLSLPPSQGIWQSWQAYWFTPRSPFGLHVIRVLTGLVLLFWLLTLAGHQVGFFGLQGWLDEEAFRQVSRLRAEEPQSVPIPTFGWSAFYVARSPALVNAIYWAAIAVLALFTLGVAPRLTGILSYLAVVSFTVSPALHYDVDFLLVILAFYLMIAYALYGLVSQRLSPLGYVLGPGHTFLLQGLLGTGAKEEERTSFAANLVVRLLQVHFAIIVVTSGLHKLQFGDWWSGIALWFPMHPPFETTHQQIRQIALGGGAERYLFVISLANYLILAWQIGFPLFAWRGRSWRVVLLGGAVIGWLGWAFLYRLPLFGPVYLIFCLAYLTPEEWRWLASWWPGQKEQPAKTPAARAWSGAKETTGEVHVKAM